MGSKILMTAWNKNWLQQKADTQKLEIIKQLVDVAFASDMEKALQYAKQGVKLAESDW